MESISTQTPIPAVGCTVPVWLPREVRGVFEAHVGKDQGKRGRYGKDAIVEKLQREGAFAAKQPDKAAEVLRGLPPDALALFVELAEMITARGEGGIAAAREALAGMKQQSLEAEPAVVR